MDRSDHKERPAWRRWWVFAIVSVLGVGAGGVVWAVLAYVQMLNAWGFRGMPKPVWFEVLSWVVWGGPVVAAVLVPLALVLGIYLLSRPRRNA